MHNILTKLTSERPSKEISDRTARIKGNYEFFCDEVFSSDLTMEST